MPGKDVFEQEVKRLAVMYNTAIDFAVVPTAAICFSPDVLKACEANICGKYNACWTCPPAIESQEIQKEKIISYSSAFVFTTISSLDDSFDYEGMIKAKERHNNITASMHEKFGKTNLVFGAGACEICGGLKYAGFQSGALVPEPCAYPEPCRFPDKIFPSIEAAGIDVSALSRAGGLRYNNGENTITYFSMLLF